MNKGRVLGYGLVAGLIVGVPLFAMMATNAGQPLFDYGAPIG